MWDLIYEVKDLQDELGCSYVHISREQNSLANSFANCGVGQSVIFNGFDIPF